MAAGYSGAGCTGVRQKWTEDISQRLVSTPALALDQEVTNCIYVDFIFPEGKFHIRTVILGWARPPVHQTTCVPLRPIPTHQHEFYESQNSKNLAISNPPSSKLSPPAQPNSPFRRLHMETHRCAGLDAVPRFVWGNFTGSPRKTNYYIIGGMPPVDRRPSLRNSFLGEITRI